MTTHDQVTATIETGRLRLRPYGLGDLAARSAMTADEEAMRFVNGPQGPQENWFRLLRYAGHWALLGYGLFAVEERASGRFVGELGLADFRRGLGDDFDAAPEAAWILARWGWGRGFGTEAMAAAIAWHEQAFGRSRTVCIIAPDNTPSLRLAEKLGYAPFREGCYHDHPVILHERAAGLP